jgi:hypothetical protein
VFNKILQANDGSRSRLQGLALAVRLTEHNAAELHMHESHMEAHAKRDARLGWHRF